MEPVKSVLDHYLKIQSELAKDSVKGVSEHANVIAKAVNGDDMKMLSPDVAKQAETLREDEGFEGAREAFKRECVAGQIPRGTTRRPRHIHERLLFRW